MTPKRESIPVAYNETAPRNHEELEIKKRGEMGKYKRDEVVSSYSYSKGKWV